jgi:hypothetical protein
MLGKSSGATGITWYKQMTAWFQEDDQVHAAVRDTAVKLTQMNDGTKGACDKQETLFCKYSLRYPATPECADAACEPLEIDCQVPVEYVAQPGSETRKAALSVAIDYKTGQAQSIQLFEDGALIAPEKGGTITPLVWKTPMTVTDFWADAKLTSTGTSFDWSRKVDASLSGGVDGTTHLAFLVADYKSDKAHLVAPAPDHAGHNFTAWKAACVDSDTKKVRIAGSVTFTAEGLQKAQVETAATAALAASLDVNAELIKITVTQARRLAVEARRLADTWKIDYTVDVPESKGEAVETALKKISEDSAEFKGHLETAVNELPGASAWPQKKTVQVTSASMPVKTSTDVESNVGDGVVDGATSQWLSSGVAVLVGLIASM